METFTSCVLTADKIANRFNPKLSKRLEQVLVINKKLQDENFNIKVSISYFIQKLLHKFRQAIFTIFFPLFLKQILHPIQTSLYIFHTFMFIDGIDFECLILIFFLLYGLLFCCLFLDNRKRTLLIEFFICLLI